MDNKNNEKKEYLLTDEDLKEISGGTSSKTPGISCPICGKFIPTSVFDLLINDRIRCPYCLNVLIVHRNNSKNKR